MADRPKSLKDELEAIRNSRGLPRKGNSVEAKQRNIQMAKAAGLATSVLKSRHKDEYDTLYRQAKQELGL